MNKKPAHFTDAADLRPPAEDRCRAQRCKARLPGPEGEPLKLLHELQVHQIELEMQNAELSRARDEAERFTDLYDFAPVGYVALDSAGTILSVNLTGARILGIERSRLLGRPLENFLAEVTRPAFAL